VSAIPEKTMAAALARWVGSDHEQPKPDWRVLAEVLKGRGRQLKNGENVAAKPVARFRKRKLQILAIFRPHDWTGVAVFHKLGVNTLHLLKYPFAIMGHKLAEPAKEPTPVGQTDKQKPEVAS
jgi:hypothetical protein